MMTDADIIKAMERCNNPFLTCEGCYLEKVGCCSIVIKTHALDIIKRQKAEIERLQGYNENLLTANTELSNEILDIKTEAIKEFAERLKKSAFDCDVSFGYGKEHYTEAVAVVEIDNLVKEMTEGKK